MRPALIAHSVAHLVAAALGFALSACGGGGGTDGAAGANRQQDLGSGSSTAPPVAPPALNAANPPGSNFKLAPFTLQLPTGSSGNVDTVNGAALAAGYTSPDYFYSDSADGSMVMMDPTQGWTTSGSLHPRVEFRENATWATTGTNKLDATVAVTRVPGTTTIGQIFQGTGPSKPLCELQVTSGGAVKLLLESSNVGGSSTTSTIATVPLGTRFDYELSLTGSTVTVTVNKTVQTLTMDASFAGESFYFKAGNYDQSAVSGTPLTTPGTVVKFYALTVTHQ